MAPNDIPSGSQVAWQRELNVGSGTGRKSHFPGLNSANSIISIDHAGERFVVRRAFCLGFPLDVGMPSISIILL